MNPWRLLAASLVLSMMGCAGAVKAPFQLPDAEWSLPAAESGALADLEHQAFTDQRAGEATGGVEEPHPSAFKLLDRSDDALRWRLTLIDSATQSIDLQYYLYHGDSTGLLVTSRLVEAADRGVRVRVIIDDMSTMAFSPKQIELRDSMAALMIAHPNISLRLFNSGPNRDALGRGIDFATDFDQLNHRMHNKSLTADNRATILGGRNIGDEYMGLNSHFNFRDIDVLGIGAVARQTSEVFDLFWNSGWVVSANDTKRSKAEAVFEEQRQAMERELRRSPELERFSLASRTWQSELNAVLPTLHYGRSEVLTDRPEADGISHDLFDWLTASLPTATSEVMMTNAYLIPDETGIGILKDLSAAGVEVFIHTNSLASHDVPAVNSHYKAMRKPILKSGALLYEARHDAEIKQSIVDTQPVASRYMGLHAKSMVIDRRYAVIGSANFDPRSAYLNSEMVAVIDSESLAAELRSIILRDMSGANSWQVVLDEDGELLWRHDTETTRRQPARSGWQRFQDAFFMLFPRRYY